ncbi:MAG: transcriptional repressor [Candidatus Marinimicrobia bacterium]|nr:transcriptional repressor [Candidatus Neomarinimicrobiota bacterium]
MRYSPQRKVILDTVRNTTKHPTAQDIFEQARMNIPSISLATVYRDLGQLIQNNMIRAIQTGNTVRYDGNITEHQHFQCSECNQLFDLDVSLKEFVFDLKTKFEHKVMSYELMLNGICHNCQ